MGAGIAAGPIIIALFGGANIYAFYICALITLFSGLISLTLRTVDLKPPIPQKNSGNSLIFIIPIAVFGGFAAGFCETSSIAFLVGYAVNEGYAMASAALLLTVFGIGGTKCSFL
jgi:hypothetical protein